MFQIHAQFKPGADNISGLTFNLHSLNEAGALMWVRTALMQLGFKPEEYSLSIQYEI